MTATYHTIDNNLFIVSKYNRLFLTSDQLEFLDSIPTPSKQHLTILEIASMFPEAVPRIKELIKEKKAEIRTLQSKSWDIKKQYSSIRNYEVSEFLIWIYTEMMITLPVQKLNEEIIKLERILSTMRAYKNNKNIGKDLATIKQIPITNYITPNASGKILCIFHNEKTPSMQYYPQNNNVYCFGCGKRGTVVDVIMKQMNLSFKDAVKFLSK